MWGMIAREKGLGKGKMDKKSTQFQITERKSELPWPQKARTLTLRLVGGTGLAGSESSHSGGGATINARY